MLTCVAQHNRVTLKRNPQPSKNYYSSKDTALVNAITQLSYDSVKVFAFNCSKIDFVGDVGYKIDSSKFYFNIKPSSPCFAYGKILAKKDAKDLLDVIRNSYKDIYKSDPVGPYIPTMGFAFYCEGVVKAHIEVSIESDKANIEITKKNGEQLVCKYEVLGNKMRALFAKRFNKYNLNCCN